MAIKWHEDLALQYYVARHCLNTKHNGSGTRTGTSTISASTIGERFDSISTPASSSESKPRSSCQRLEYGLPVPPTAHLQTELILRYDINRYDFVSALKAVLDEPEEQELSDLHNSARCYALRTCGKKDIGPRSNPWNSRYQRSRGNLSEHDRKNWGNFLKVYHDFLRIFVLDNLEVDYIAFQSYPSFRCHLPNAGAVGRPHRDEDYHHGCSEINFWIPFTTVWGSNSLQVESSRGKGDFHPLEACLGDAIRFYGNQVWHYNVENETNSTRVSIDFRVIRKCGNEWSASSFARFKLGEYFYIMSRDGLVEPGSDEFNKLIAELVVWRETGTYLIDVFCLCEGKDQQKERAYDREREACNTVYITQYMQSTYLLSSRLVYRKWVRSIVIAPEALWADGSAGCRGRRRWNARSELVLVLHYSLS